MQYSLFYTKKIYQEEFSLIDSSTHLMYMKKLKPSVKSNFDLQQLVFLKLFFNESIFLRLHTK